MFPSSKSHRQKLPWLLLQCSGTVCLALGCLFYRSGVAGNILGSLACRDSQGRERAWLGCGHRAQPRGSCGVRGDTGERRLFARIGSAVCACTAAVPRALLAQRRCPRVTGAVPGLSPGYRGGTGAVPALQRRYWGSPRVTGDRKSVV